MRGQYGHAHSNSQSIGIRAQLSNAYQELGKELTSNKIKVIGNYTLGRKIGEGSYGQVRLGVHRLTSTRVAIKQIPKSLPSSQFGQSSYSTPLQLLTREIHHHRRFHHPHVVQLYEIIATESSIFLVSELCAGGELFDYLIEHEKLSPAESRKIFGQLCLGLAYIHSLGVVHRDLKMENVLLDERINVKIADFGFGREFEGKRMLETWCGTTGYAAPEMLSKKRYTGEEVDIWSAGVIFYAISTGSMPFDEDNEMLLIAKVTKGEYYMPEWLGEDFCDLISSILQIEPTKRRTIRQILGHRWFQIPLPQSHSHNSQNDYDGVPPSIPEAEETVSYPSANADVDFIGDVTVIPPTPTMSGTEEAEESSRSSSEAALSLFGDESKKGMSGTSSPITSDDDAQPIMSRSSSAGGRKDESKLGFHRNESQSTIRKGSDDVDSRGSSPRVGPGPSRTPSLPTHIESSSQSDDELYSTARTFSSSSRPSIPSSFTSSSSTITPTQPHRAPPPPASSFLNALPSVPTHSRTPSRTKRRSIGSVISDRTPFHAETEYIPHVDYLAALNQQSSPQWFQTDLEKRLLDGLEMLGFDIGQVQHSVKVDACDAAGAMWWILKKKMEDKQEGASDVPLVEDDPAGVEEEEEEILRPSMDQNPSTSRVNLDQLDDESENEGAASKGKQRRTMFGHSSASGGSKEDLKSKKSSGSLISDVLSIASSPSGVFSTLSAPAMAFFGFPKESSPGPENQSREVLPTWLRNNTTSFSSDRPLRSMDPTTQNQTGSKLKRNVTKPRSASVGVFQRATNVFTLASKKSEELKKEKVREGSDDRSVASTPLDDNGRSTPNLAGFFSRKQSSVSVETPKSPPSTPPHKISKEEEKRPSTATSLSLNHNESAKSLPAPQMTQATVSTDSLRVVESIAPKSPTSPTSGSVISSRTARKPKSNFFSGFKLWFNEDRRKRAKRPNVPYSSDSLSRRTTVRRNDGSLRRRGGSTGTSRRSSQASLHPTIVEYSHHRRLSESSRRSVNSRPGSRTPTSEKARSRPPSSQSYYRRKGHVRAESQGSTNSIRRHGKASPAPSYRRPPTSSTVRRVSQATFTNKRPNKKSSSTSIRSQSSSRPPSVRDRRNSHSSSEFESVEENPPIQEEENESLSDSVEDARGRAFRKLSGEFSFLGSCPTARLRQSQGLFGPPSSVRSSTSTIRPALPPLRNVFAKSRDEDGEWVDEDEDLDGYGGGLGQPSTKSSASSNSSADGHTFATQQQRSILDGTLEASGGALGSSLLGEGRYAGIGTDTPWRPGTLRTNQSTFKAPVIEEEEEEEE